jgi:hypothetical protein
LLPSVDLFITKQQLPDFKIDAAIVSNSKESAQKTKLNFKSYHKIGIGTNDEFFDFSINLIDMTSLYDKYNEIIISADMPVAFSQFFFDAVYKSNKVVLKTNDEKICGEILDDLFETSEEDEEIASIIKRQIKKKHTCFNRASLLMSALKIDNAAKMLNQISEKL